MVNGIIQFFQNKYVKLIYLRALRYGQGLVHYLITPYASRIGWGTELVSSDRNEINLRLIGHDLIVVVV